MASEIIIKHIDITPGRRVLVTSDIHGHLTHLKNVLKKASFSKDDLLIIIGDIIEKGPESLNTLRYVMDLYEAGNVMVLAGNVDTWRVAMFDNLNENTADRFMGYLHRMRQWKGTSLFDEMTRELGFIAENSEDLISLKGPVSRSFQNELDFIRGLPAILETQRYIFVHAGLPDKNMDALKSRSIFDVLQFNCFISSGLCFDKYVVVGHWPVTLYDEKIAQANPIINREQKIISIDGGCGLKRDGQLNVLIIPDILCDANEITFASYDDFPVYTATRSQAASENSINIRFEDNTIRVLEKQDDFTYAEHIRTDYKLWIYNDYLYDHETRCDDYTDYMLPITAGDSLSLVHTTSRGYIVKHRGVSGWYCGDLDRLDNCLIKKPFPSGALKGV